MPGDRNLPTVKPHQPKKQGYTRCPDCGATHIRGGAPKLRADASNYAYLRSCVNLDTKRAVLDASRAEGVSMSEIVRRALRLWFADRAQGS